MRGKILEKMVHLFSHMPDNDAVVGEKNGGPEEKGEMPLAGVPPHAIKAGHGHAGLQVDSPKEERAELKLKGMC